MKRLVSVRWVLVALAVAGIAVVGYYGFQYVTKEENANVPMQATTRVIQGDLSVSVSGAGSIEPVNKQTIKSSVNGTIEKVLVKEGDLVAKGDVLVTFERSDLTSQIRSKSLSIQKLEIELKQLHDNYKKADDANRESLMISIERQQLDLEAAREELIELQGEGSTEAIVAPFDGVILAVSAEAGNNVNTNAEIAQIANYDVLKIVVPVDELDIPEVKLGQAATIWVDAFENETFTGVVTEIAREGRTSNGVASFDVTVQIDDAKSIKSGMSAEASIVVMQKSSVMMLPIDAVQSSRSGYYVMLSSSAEGASPESDASGARMQREGSDQAQLPRGERPTRGEGTMPMGGRQIGQVGGRIGTPGSNAEGTLVMVEVGIANEDYIEIVSGLSVGDTVILPTTTAASSSNMMMQGGFGGIRGVDVGGFGGGGMPTGGGFGGGGMPTGGGFSDRMPAGGGGR